MHARSLLEKAGDSLVRAVCTGRRRRGWAVRFWKSDSSCQWVLSPSGVDGVIGAESDGSGLSRGWQAERHVRRGDVGPGRGDEKPEPALTAPLVDGARLSTPPRHPASCRLRPFSSIPDASDRLEQRHSQRMLNRRTPRSARFWRPERNPQGDAERNRRPNEDPV